MCTIIASDTYFSLSYISTLIGKIIYVYVKLFYQVSRVIDINILPSQSRYHVRKHISFENAASLIKHQAFSYGCLSS